MYLTDNQILDKSEKYSKSHSKDALQQLCLQQGYAGGYGDAQEAAYNQAIDDILSKIVNGEVNGINMSYPPESLIYVFNKLKK